MVKIGTFPPNLALICLTGSEKMGFTDGRLVWRYGEKVPFHQIWHFLAFGIGILRTDDGRPRDDSSSAVQ